MIDVETVGFKWTFSYVREGGEVSLDNNFRTDGEV